MQSNSRFAVAIHVLTLLAQSPDQPVTSDYIAGSVNTNPVVIRRLLASLRRAGLVTSQGGHGGGWMLAAPACAITLRDVYRRVSDTSLFALHNRQPNQRCPVGRNIQRSLTAHFMQASSAMQDELGRTTIADILNDVVPAAG
jgi:Rrf2 family protein